MNIDVYTIGGEKSGEIELPDNVFNIEPHEHSMYQAVRTYLAHQRQGTHKTKQRSEVRGGGKKPWRQKGRGTARAGTTRSPLWVGGGNIHGPKPHKYSHRLTKKMKRLARKSALTLRVRESNVVVVEDFQFDNIKTNQMASVLQALNLGGEKVLQILPANDPNVFLSSRNIAKLNTTQASNVSTYDILSHKKLLLHKSAIDALVQTFDK